MNPLDLLHQKLDTAARKPPLLARTWAVTKATRTIASRAATSSGRARPVTRQSLQQQRASLDLARGQAVKSATEDVLTQAKELLT